MPSASVPRPAAPARAPAGRRRGTATRPTTFIEPSSQRAREWAAHSRSDGQVRVQRCRVQRCRVRGRVHARAQVGYRVAMRISRRRVLQSLAAAGLLGIPSRAPARDLSRIAPGPFKPSRESLAAWQVPDWFRDAKFGIWAHWGPQSSVEAGDWYARNMYIEGSAQYKYHLETYGHPSKVGFKDVIPKWKAETLRSVHLMTPLQEGRRPLLHEHGGAPRQLRSLELRAHPLERRGHGPTPRRRRRVCRRRAP